MSDDSDGQIESGRWASVAEAALHHKRTTRTIERWVEVGRLKRHPTASPILVWIADGQASDDASDMSDDSARQMMAAEERVLALAERMSAAVGQHAVMLQASLNDALVRVEVLARENGQKQERIDALERVLDVVRQMSDDAEKRADDLAARLARTEAERDDARAERGRRRWRAWWWR